MNPSRETTPPYSVSEDTRLKLTVKTLLGIVGAVALGVAAWFSLKADVSTHGAQLQAIQQSQADDHDTLKVQGAQIQQQGLLLERMDRKLDYLTRSRSGFTGNGGGGASP